MSDEEPRTPMERAFAELAAVCSAEGGCSAVALRAALQHRLAPLTSRPVPPAAAPQWNRLLRLLRAGDVDAAWPAEALQGVAAWPSERVDDAVASILVIAEVIERQRQQRWHDAIRATVAKTYL